MKIRFYIDPETELPHIYRHSVDEQEVEQILSKPGEDRPGSDGSRVAVGQTTFGRYLRSNLRTRSGTRKRVRNHCL